MIQGGERAAVGTAAQKISAWLRSKCVLLRDEVVVGSPDLARIGLIGLALALQSCVLWLPGHFRPAGEWYYAVLVSLCTLGSLGLTLTATLGVKQMFGLRVRRLLGAAALISFAILSVLGVAQMGTGIHHMLQGTPYSNDGAVMDLHAAQQVRNGHNPYLKSNIEAALANMNAPATTSTPLMRGLFAGSRTYPSPAAIQQVFTAVQHYRSPTIPVEFESKYNYPAGSFLFILPFVWAGMHDMRFLYALAVIAMGGYLWFRMPRSLRVLVPLIILGNVPLILMTAGGQPDPVYAFFLMIGYGEWASPWLSPLSMGLAIGTKQLAWFFLPFYLVLVARQFGLREAARRSGIMALVFAVMNAPFIVQSPGAYLSSISGPMTDPMFPLGIGIIALFVSNVLPMLPKVAFTCMEIGAWATGFGASLRVRYVTAASGAVFAALPLFFAWRSLVNYFYMVPLLALAIALAEPWQRRSSRRESV